MATSKVAAFEHLLGTMPDAKIAEMAGVLEAAVGRYRTNKGIAPFKKAAESEGEPELDEQEPDEERVDLDDLAGDDLADAIASATAFLTARGYTVLKPGDAIKAKPARRGPPACVKAIKSARLTRPGSGRRWRMGYGDVFTGDEAKYLWENHRNLVKAYGE